jgi:hypothetical protein
MVSLIGLLMVTVEASPPSRTSIALARVDDHD